MGFPLRVPVPNLRAGVTGPNRILVVEDDHAIRDAIAEVLAERGYLVSCASNGAEALELLATGDPPGLIVLDLMMPVMDGWAFRMAQLEDPRLARIPVLVVSAGQLREGEALAALGVDAFLAKPFELDRFVSEVHRFC